MATLDLAVAAGADDAYEKDNSTGFNSTLAAVWMSSHTTDASLRYNGGYRFTGVTIQGVTIDVGYTTHRAVGTANDDPNVDIHAEDVDNAANFTTTADVTSRVRTTASVQWTATGIGTGAVNSPSIVSVLQELADRPSFADDAAVILLDGRSDATAGFSQTSYEGNTTLAAKLHIEYTAGGAAVAPSRMMMGVGV